MAEKACTPVVLFYIESTVLKNITANFLKNFTNSVIKLYINCSGLLYIYVSTQGFAGGSCYSLFGCVSKRFVTWLE